jgi:hypothetical protein
VSAPWALTLTILATSAQAQSIPDDFPRFIVPGHQDTMDSLRAMYWLHYPGSGPKATLWDEWLTTPSLWPAVDTDDRSDEFRVQWARTLRGRDMDREGYVATHQHASIAHQQGWPFPFWKQGGPDTWGWHFSLPGLAPEWHGTEARDQTGWRIEGGEDDGVHDDAWWVRLTKPNATVRTPEMRVDPLQSPFIQIRWKADGLEGARPYLEWTREDAPNFDFGSRRRMYFDAPTGDGFTYTMVPVYRNPEWRGIVTQLRINFGNPSEATVGVQAVFTQYDTRHNINNANFVRGCAKYFAWTGDLAFLREEIGRMRAAMRYVMDEFHTRDEHIVRTDWVGHGGRTGIQRDADGDKTLLYGRGVGNNYWDLLPFGNKDAYATIQYYDAVRRLAALERAIAAYPEWNVPRGPLAFDADWLEAHAEDIKRTGNELFWNDETGRFVAAIDIDGNAWDYGFTFLNLEAIYYDFATDEHAESIMAWIAGDRIVDGDTAQGDDIYHWRFGPRATTKRNVDYYGWFWSNPESIPWGGQVQDGGAVLGFSFHDLMARLHVRGPDDAWQRLQEVITWFDEVEAAGGYRAFYDGSRDGTLQGGGTAGGLGCDKEFFESVLVPQIVLEGFLGLEPTPDGFQLTPRLPSDWESLEVTRIRLRDFVYDIRVGEKELTVTTHASPDRPPEVAISSFEESGSWTDGSTRIRYVYGAGLREVTSTIVEPAN